MSKFTLYKAGCDPYMVSSQEELEFHLNQGWSIKPTEEATKPAAPITTGKQDTKELEALRNQVAELKSQLSKAQSETAGVDQIKDLNDVIKAKDQQMVDMQSDFEELTKQMSDDISKLKEQLATKTKSR